MNTLGDALPAEIERIKTQVIPAYQEIGTPGMFALMMMQSDLNTAIRALAEGDTVAMIRSYQALKEYKL